MHIYISISISIYLYINSRRKGGRAGFTSAPLPIFPHGGEAE